MVRNEKAKRMLQKRLTVSLGPGQREALEAIAERNNATLAFVVRYAITEFVENEHGRRVRLSFPETPASEA